jgi:hypothetical protein
VYRTKRAEVRNRTRSQDRGIARRRVGKGVGIRITTGIKGREERWHHASFALSKEEVAAQRATADTPAEAGARRSQHEATLGNDEEEEKHTRQWSEEKENALPGPAASASSQQPTNSTTSTFLAMLPPGCERADAMDEAVWLTSDVRPLLACRAPANQPP